MRRVRVSREGDLQGLKPQHLWQICEAKGDPKHTLAQISVVHSHAKAPRIVYCQQLPKVSGILRLKRTVLKVAGQIFRNGVP